MGEKNLWSKVGLIALLTGLCLWQSYPLSKLKQGIDLGGGYSLTFEIDDTGAKDQPDLAERVMTVLRNRVDPQGTMNLVWRPIGRNRLEIQMPNPPKEQRAARELYNATREALASTYLQEAVIRDALDQDPARRAERFDRFSRYAIPTEEAAKQMEADKTATIPMETITMERRRELLRELAEAREEYQELYSATTQPAGAEAEKMDNLLIQQREIMSDLLETNLNENLVIDVLELGAGNETRREKLSELKDQHPDYAVLIDRLAKVYDAYSLRKGVLDDPSDLMRMIRGAGVLEFRILAEPDRSDPTKIAADDPALQEPIDKYVDQLNKRGPRKIGEEPYAWFEVESNNVDDFEGRGFITEEYLGRTYVLAHDSEEMALLHHDPPTWSLKSARQGMDRRGRPAVDFTLDGKGGAKFGRMTEENIGNPLCIFLDKTAISAATIQSQILTSGQITGDFGLDRVRYLVNTLEAGSLPARLKEVPLQQKSVGPSLGATNRANGIRAIVIAFIATIIFMMFYYGYNGFIADIALLMNLVITIGVMSFIQATFTLAGIAGLVLTLGMAVDANVLIFERIREELQRGVSVRMAIKLGYEKAFSAILDSNVTTIITAIILGSLGSEDIKGFGLTLGIGLSTSLFTALFVTRQFFHIMVPSRLDLTETKKAWLGSIGLSLAGGVLFGLGYAISGAAARNESNLIGFGEFLLVIGVSAVVLLGCMWIFRLVYQGTGHAKSNRLPMMKLFGQPNINWMGKYRIFWAISAVIIAGGFLFEANVETEQYLDIEFLGGTQAQVTLKGDPEVKQEYGQNPDQVIRRKIVGEGESEGTSAVAWLRRAQDTLAGTTVESVGENGIVELTLPDPLTESQLTALLTPQMKEVFDTTSVETEGTTARFRLKLDEDDQPILRLEGVQTRIEAAAAYAGLAANKMRDIRVQPVEVAAGVQEAVGPGTETAEQPPDKAEPGPSFDVITTETSAPLVAEAILAAMGEDLVITERVDYDLVTDLQSAPEGLFPIAQTDEVLSDVIGGENQENIGEHKGGFALVFENLNPPLSRAEVDERMTEVLQLPDFANVRYRQPTVIGLQTAEAPGSTPVFSRMAIVAHDPMVRYVEDDPEGNAEWRAIAESQLEIARAAFESESAFQSLTAFAPQMAGESSQKAVIAILLSLLAIATYLWIRFGSVEYGVAGIIALYHDVAVTLSLVMLCHHIHDTFIGRLLMLSDFRIDLAMIAAFLTIVGYSINDSIVIFDRIRENRGRMATVSSRLINTSLNQTLSRTLITSFTTFLVVLVMYLLGGQGIHGFAFAMIVGVVSGSYSTLAIATPMLQHPRVMWSVAAVLAGVTLLAILSTIDTEAVRYTLGAIVIILAILVILKQVAMARAGIGRPVME